MLKKNEVLKALQNGCYILVDTISRNAVVMAAPGERVDSCRYDTAENIANSDGYTRRNTDWFAVYHVVVDPPAEEAREDMTAEEIETNVARIVRGVIGKEKAAKMMASNRRRGDYLEVFLCHGGCCLGDVIEIQEAILAAGYFIPAQMGNAVIHVTARGPEAQEEAAPEQEQPDQEEEQNARAIAQTLQDGIEDALRAFEAAGVISNLTIEPLPAKREAQEEAQEEAAAAIEEPEETAQERAARENRETCRRIAEEVEAYASGQCYRCPECGELIQFDDLDELEHDTTDGGTCYVLPCGCETTDEPEQMSLYDYFEDCLDVEYRVGADREYRSVCVMVTCGGPNIYVDTQRRAVCLYWWTETAEYPLLSDAVDAVDAWAEEYWSCL